jgi:hypothetical protein
MHPGNQVYQWKIPVLLAAVTRHLRTANLCRAYSRERHLKKKKLPSGVRKPSAKEKIALIEKKIVDLESRLPDASLKEAGGIERQIRLHREELEIQKTHLISKLNRVRNYLVSGSYGSNN